MPKAKKLPRQLFINIENPNTEDEYFAVSEKNDQYAEIGVKRTVGVYVLSETLIVEGVAKITPQ
ncbi:MAG: hypothetical protein QOI07_946 [Verrucomicrobiota bacterium]|jgi:hypothetical protein